MNDQYLEEGIKCLDTGKNKAIRAGLIVLVLFTFILVLINPVLIISPLLYYSVIFFVVSGNTKTLNKYYSTVIYTTVIYICCRR